MSTESEQKPWRLSVGCHRGTMMSRDNQSVTTKFRSNEPLESLEDCRECARHWKENYRLTGYLLWFANAIAPDGTQHNSIIPGNSYR